MGLALLLGCQLAGELIGRALALPLPGPVLGILLVLVMLALRIGVQPLGAACELLLAHLSLLFVPVGVGVVTHLDTLSEHGAALVGVIVLSTWVGLAACALVLRLAWSGLR
ncbi:CidA/LrgA family protein [Pseudorhodoferax sp.]|uniref:CidA/LrgA family protein n=1 Tax=Pseudorhodoferax sp. TaxID=1993553 RepID=UPI002DD66548|nr:CidA/LrgA family protein [Pseudorhodoferax sp.]